MRSIEVGDVEAHFADKALHALSDLSEATANQ
jgi:hypothetical protein